MNQPFINYKSGLATLNYYFKRSIRKKPYVLLITPSLLVLLGFFIIPLFFLFLSSFHHYVPGKGTVVSITLENYTKFFTDFFYVRILLETLLLGLIVTVLTLIIGYPVAYFIARTKSNRKGFYLALIIFSLLLNIVVRSFSWIVLLSDKGLINDFLIKFHVIEHPLRLLFNMKGVVIGLTHIFLPFMIVALASVIQNIETDYEEAAQVLGASKFKTFFKITLPLSLPGIIAGSLLVFLLTISAFVTPRLLGGVKFKVIANIIFQEFMNTFNWPFGAALAFILLFATLAIISFYLKMFSKKNYV